MIHDPERNILDSFLSQGYTAVASVDEESIVPHPLEHHRAHLPKGTSREEVERKFREKVGRLNASKEKIGAASYEKVCGAVCCKEFVQLRRLVRFLCLTLCECVRASTRGPMVCGLDHMFREVTLVYGMQRSVHFISIDFALAKNRAGQQVGVLNLSRFPVPGARRLAEVPAAGPSESRLSPCGCEVRSVRSRPRAPSALRAPSAPITQSVPNAASAPSAPTALRAPSTPHAASALSAPRAFPEPPSIVLR